MQSPLPPFKQQRKFYQLRRIKRSATENKNPYLSHYLSFDDYYNRPVYETRYKGNSDSRRSKSSKPSSTTLDKELEDLADDHFFHDQVRQDRKLKNHPLKKDVEVFDVRQMKQFGESAEDKSKGGKNFGASDERNYEFVHDSKKLGKNEKYKNFGYKKCVECESLDNATDSDEFESNEKDKEKIKIIDEFQRRIFNSREKRVKG